MIVLIFLTLCIIAGMLYLIKLLYKRIEELGEIIADLERGIERLEANNCD